MIEDQIEQRPLTERESKYLDLLNQALIDPTPKDLYTYNLLSNEEIVRLVGIDVTDYFFARAIREAKSPHPVAYRIRLDISASALSFINNSHVRQTAREYVEHYRRNKISVLLSLIEK